ncbi:hypothetical protein L596_021246 [Steinernema carpocapsae]|uniref:USP domain-containing protein n=1 Tax=Steinernema carpocapsae TaxID=34508 RepID=A0A4U5MWD3_STECR|nr:hypothetical protein L596_021246 [Steinernema carpocapsae]
MALFPTTNETKEFNKVVTSLLQLETVEVHAEDSDAPLRKGQTKRERPWQRKEFSIKTPRDDAALQQDLLNRYEKEIEAATGGLQTVLSLPINGRVMLRRKIDRSPELVNGATGVLQKINYSNDGSVQSVDVFFDRGVGLRTINRVSAIYEPSPDVRITRSQFPLVVAFAVTIHKCQGLTLKNAIVGTKNCFAAGQVFVALSRVTNINGLHLADFAPEKILVNKESLVEYNRLRSTIDLPAFDVPVQEPSRKRPFDFNKRQNVKQVVTTPVPIKKPAVTKKKPRLEEDLETEDPTLPLDNLGDDCFLIAAVNLLYGMKDVRQEVERANDNGAVISELQRVFRKESSNNVLLLRQQLHEDLHSGHQSALVALEDMLRHLPADVVDHFAFNATTTDFCQCQPVGVRLQETPTVLHVDLRHHQSTGRNNKLKFTEALERTTTPDVANCRSCEGARTRTVHYGFPEEQTHLLVAIDQREPPVGLDGMNKKGINALGYTWRPVAAFEHQPGHFVCWIAGEAGWMVQDDAAPPRPARQMLSNLIGYTVIAFKKVAVYKARK